MKLKSVVLFLFFQFVLYSQQISNVTLNNGGQTTILNAENIAGNYFLSAIQFFKSLNINTKYLKETKTLKVFIEQDELTFKIDNPFVIRFNKKDSTQKAIQLTHSPYFANNDIFVFQGELIELFNSSVNNIVLLTSPTRLQVVDRSSQQNSNNSAPQIVKNRITLKFIDDQEKSHIKIESSAKAPEFSSFFRDQNLHLVLWNVVLQRDSSFSLDTHQFIEKVDVKTGGEFTEIIMQMKQDEIVVQHVSGENDKEFSLQFTKREFGNWYVQESENFICIFRNSHSHLVTHLLASAENAYGTISKLFNYKAEDKIIINTYDVSDYGFGAASTVPNNLIRLEIEPMEPGMEVVPFNERFQWLLSHELVHIVVNDSKSDTEGFFRSLFGKINPEKPRPLTILYSLLTNNNRYTPRWHQESSAVYLETWLSGGFGRVLGSFDEMFFRTMVLEGKEFPDDNYLDGLSAHQNFILETQFYIYGGRFLTHLAIKHGNEKVISWFRSESSNFYPSYKGKFENIFGYSFDSSWDDFISKEIKFQRKNLALLSTSKPSPVHNLGKLNLGWVSQPFYSKKLNSFIVANHRPGELASLKIINRATLEEKELISIRTPSLIQVSSIAYDDSLDNVFYTTNNNQLARDIHVIDLKTNEDRLLFKDFRTGHLTISSKMHVLWGVQHSGGKASIVRSKFPYDILETMVVFDVGDEIQQISLNNQGNLLAAVIHRVTGQQSIVISDITNLDEGGAFQFQAITSSGSPENPSWSANDNFLFWNAYTNGVSNIFRYNFATGEIAAISHTLAGLFKPVSVSSDSIFCFKFSSDGMLPVIIPNEIAPKLPAINYLGQTVLEKNPEVINWNLPAASSILKEKKFSDEKVYSGISKLNIQAFIPIISGFQKRKVLGFYSLINDPLLTHEISLEAGISPFKESTEDIDYHVKFKYEFKQSLYFAVDHNAPDFYDLFNKRKRGTLGTRYSIGHSDYWLYDNPHKIKQTTEFSYFNDIKFINDNSVELSEPDFMFLKTEFDSKNFRRTIGSFDTEQGNQFRINLLGYGTNFNQFEYSVGTYFEWDNYSLYLFKHNVFRFKFSAGYHTINDKLIQGQFFFGGFGNREVESEPVRQFEKLFSFPGTPIYSIPTQKFLKIMIGNIFPPVRFSGISIWSHYVKNVNFSVFSQGLYTDSPFGKKWVNVGSQINVVFSHWYNLESTFSAGIAQAWWENGKDWEWFLSLKLLRD